LRVESLAVVVSAAVVGLAAGGCGGSSPPSAPEPGAPSVDCAGPLGAEFRVDLPGEEVPTGESRLATVRPGIAYPCAERVAGVEWSLDGPAVVRVSVIPGTDSSVTSRAWLTGLTPGSVTVRARIVLKDGSVRQARPSTVRVGQAPPAPGGRLVVDEAVLIKAETASTAPSTVEMPLVLPLSGRVEMVVDWDSTETAGVRCTLREGFWNPSNPGRVVIDSLTLGAYSSTLGAKPQRAFAEYLPAGDYSFQILADMKVGASDVLHYQVRVSPR
jgi:hypothetical protein